MLRKRNRIACRCAILFGQTNTYRGSSKAYGCHKLKFFRTFYRSHFSSGTALSHRPRKLLFRRPVTADSHIACRDHAVPLTVRMCLSHFIYTVRPCLIHTYHAAPMQCSDHAVLLKATAQHGHRETAMLWRGLEKNGMVRAWHGRGMARVNQTRQHCVNQMAKTHSKPFAAWHGHGMLGVNRP